jgi:hypothetical protein
MRIAEKSLDAMTLDDPTRRDMRFASLGTETIEVKRAPAAG